MSDYRSTSRLNNEPDIEESSSDMTTGLPPMVNSRGKALISDLRRNSMSADDNERFKIDTTWVAGGKVKDRARGREAQLFCGATGKGKNSVATSGGYSTPTETRKAVR
uniref:Uncharacterized protein n=1 Tax=Davidia involucrata TaxID=16924 RepID=A0A5B6Z0U8_DAVIN